METCIDCPELLDEQKTIDERKPVGQIKNNKTKIKRKSRPYNDDESIIAALSIPKVLPTFFNKFSENGQHYMTNKQDNCNTNRDQKIKRSKTKEK